MPSRTADNIVIFIIFLLQYRQECRICFVTCMTIEQV
jgi:hypothetical protein